MLTSKFGGTSVKDALSMLQAAGILINSQKPVLCVLSASSGITDKLIETANLAAQGEKEAYYDNCIFIKKRHLEIVSNLIKNNEDLKQKAMNAVEQLCNKLFNLAEGIYLLNELTPRTYEGIQSFGELLSSTIFYYLLQNIEVKSAWFDARKLMRISRSENSKPYIETGNEEFLNLKKALENNEIVVTQGFIALDEEGGAAVIGRGGSDYSASLFGAALGADEIQIWSDVNGILTTDPRIVPNAKTINFIDFDEVREMSFFGAKVLHPDTIMPAMEKEIPVRCLNTFIADHPGTLIMKAQEGKPVVVKTLVYKKNCLLISAKANNDESPASVLAFYLESLNLEKAGILTATLSESSIFILLDNLSYLEQPAFERILKNPQVKAETCNLITFCGKNISTTQNFGKIFLKIVPLLEGIKPSHIIYGASPNSILFICQDEVSPEIQAALHESVIG